MENGTKFISWSAGRIIIGLIGAIILAVMGFIQSVNSVSQDNRVGIEGTETNIETIKSDITEIKRDIRSLLNKKGL